MTTPYQSIPQAPSDDHSHHGWTPLMDSLPQGVILVGSGGRYLEANPAAAEILGMDRETLLSCSLPEPWSNLTEADGTALMAEDFPGLVALRTGKLICWKRRGRGKEDGSTIWLELFTQPLYGRGGALVSLDQTCEHPPQLGGK